MRSTRPYSRKKDATMREINNSTSNLNPTNFQKVESKMDINPSQEPVQETEPKAVVTENLANSPEAIIGRSQVNKADSLENDMKFMLNNPEAVEKAVKFYGLAEKMLKDKGVEDSYEQAAVLANAFKDEFLTK